MDLRLAIGVLIDVIVNLLTEGSEMDDMGRIILFE